MWAGNRRPHPSIGGGGFNQSTQRLESTTIERQQRINMVVYERQEFTLLYRRKY
ncbi:hypothetical protein C7S14_8167 [Burkholderia cepacia]|nr:hypothetical protein C7S14_8167 [Burkholderia cepacia]